MIHIQLGCLNQVLQIEASSKRARRGVESQEGGWICPQGKWRVAFLPSFLHLTYPFIWTRSIMTTMMMIMSLSITMAMSTVRSGGWRGGVAFYMMHLLLIGKLWPRPPEAELQSHLCSKPATCSSFWGGCTKLFWTFSKSIKRPNTHNVESISRVQGTHFRPKIHWSSVHSQMYWFYKALHRE